MGHVYTPGLKVSELVRIRKRRILPLKGEVLVQVGDRVNPDTVVARTFLPGKVEIYNAAGLLGVDPKELGDHMIKRVGDWVEANEAFALSKGFFGLLKTQVKAKFRSRIESISPLTGQVILRGEPEAVEIRAYIKGWVVELIPEEGVVVETVGSFVQGIFGVGGEKHGKLAVVVSSPSEPLDDSKIKEEHAGKILVGGSFVTASAIRKAFALGVKGIIAGGLDDQDLRDFLGYDIGVAITGHENIPTTLVITEGFGEMTMATRTFELLKKYDDYEVSINGATQIRAGVIRPEVIIPREDISEADIERIEKQERPGLAIGSLVRVIRAPYFGRLAYVSALPPELQPLETESKTRVLEVTFVDDNTKAIIPRANVELFEE